ncbi:MAG: VOC family protein [Gemmataceae bacterium]|nr:VOC family protein [Gemmata sp.]MDW8198898.1 VOC family protein [Gemmataceae bacterium]
MTEPFHFMPQLRVDNLTKALAFYHAALGAEEVSRQCAADGRVQSVVLKIENALLTVSAENDQSHRATPEVTPRAQTPTLHLNVACCDAAIERAVQAGATLTLPPRDMFWGERYGTITDPFGQQWSFSQPLSGHAPAEPPAAPPSWGQAAA